MSKLPKSTLPSIEVDGTPLDLSTLKREFDQADQFAREVQSFRKKAAVPAQNELRNVGYHLLHALTDRSEPSEDQIVRAINHCKRASYEAAEAGIISALLLIDQFKNDYKDKIAIQDVIPNWSAIMAECAGFQEQLSLSRNKGNDRSSDYSMHMAAFRRLKEICTIADVSRDALNQKIAERQEAKRRFVIQVILGVFAIAAAFAAAAIFG